LLCCATSVRTHAPPLLLPIAFVGELSYGLYLLHPLVLYATGVTLRAFGNIPGYIAFLTVAIAIAALSYRYYEKPSERFVRGLLTTSAATAG
jgi:peptidoglycan/LPS O-acetylase OafA/YrhL